MTLEGADLAAKSKVERIESTVFKKLGNALELMKKLKEKGACFGVCPPCADYYAANDKVDFIEKAGGRLADEEHTGRLGGVDVSRVEK
jgi:predicted peroxiredoxin